MTLVRKKAQVWIWSRTPQGELRVLLLKTVPDRGGFWQPVTGHVDPGESYEQAALREAREESGLTFATQPQSLDFRFEFDGRWGPAVEEAFSLEVPGLPVCRVDPSEHTESRWVRSDEALSLLHYECNRQSLQKLLEKLGLFLGSSQG